MSLILAKDADLDTKLGRHLLAGALANFAFSFTAIMIANYALRKGEKMGLVVDLNSCS